MALSREHDGGYADRDQAGDRRRDKLPSFHTPLLPSLPAASQPPTSLVALFRRVTEGSYHSNSGKSIKGRKELAGELRVDRIEALSELTHLTDDPLRDLLAMLAVGVALH